MQSAKNYTVITGASQGLGKAFAEICGKHGRNLVLISLPNENLTILKQNLIQKYDIEVLTFELDLTDSSQLYDLCKELKNYQIDILVNNAGMGGTKAFLDATSEYIDNIVLLNMRSLVILTHQLLPQLKQQNQAFILNISSLAAFVPMPFKTIYPASKAFVYSFSRGLQTELKKTHVHVAVAHPGGMPTNPDVAKRIGSHKGLVRLSILSPEKTAEICMEKLMKKEAIIIPGKINQLSSVLQRIIPINFQLNLISAKIKKELEIIK
ncbi:SDR family NAD(P)-dependent oxidoreductase [Moheibacter sediminis]|uniref:Short-chain dehydrogenase n=1 Tax=Moheibacter sediminis TaxID=1434700 RepID=A0A1W2C6L9_9FLAO|nr:SDR family NAD(P)-dependent oxidoreductase [Moheibacter sediminis]SMC80338.1 hypothetical protein SAMN06296427_108149 [Moheibacter sediminis]